MELRVDGVSRFSVLGALGFALWGLGFELMVTKVSSI